MSHSEKIPMLSSLRYGSYLKTAGNLSPGLPPTGVKRSAARRTPSFMGIQMCSTFTSYNPDPGALDDSADWFPSSIPAASVTPKSRTENKTTTTLSSFMDPRRSFLRRSKIEATPQPPAKQYQRFL